MLVFATSALCIVGLGYVALAFVGSLKPTEATLLSHQLEISLNSLEPGQVLQVDWEGVDVFILRRTPAQVEWLRSYNPPELNDFFQLEDQPQSFRNSFRSLNPEYFVVGVWKNGSKWSLRENKRFSYLCDDFRYSSEPLQVSRLTAFPGGFYCASMYGRSITNFVDEAWVYDPAGRSNSKWISPLFIPPHKLERNKIVLGY